MCSCERFSHWMNDCFNVLLSLPPIILWQPMMGVLLEPAEFSFTKSRKWSCCKNNHNQHFSLITRGKVLWESTNPHESVFIANTWQHLPHLLLCDPIVPNFLTELFCKQSPVFVNNRRFMQFFDRYFNIPLLIAMKHELFPFSLVTFA